MTTWRDIFRLHKQNPTWTAKELAKAAGCSVEQIRSCAQRHALKIPRERHPTVNPNNVIALGKQARRFGLSMDDLEQIGKTRPPKLSPQDVAEIEAAFAGGRGERTALAKRYDVNPRTIARVLDGTYWDQLVFIPKQEAAE